MGPLVRQLDVCVNAAEEEMVANHPRTGLIAFVDAQRRNTYRDRQERAVFLAGSIGNSGYMA